MCDNGCGPIIPIEEIAEAVKELLQPETPLNIEEIANVCEKLNFRVSHTAQGRVYDGNLTLMEVAKAVYDCLELEDRFTDIEDDVKEQGEAIEALQEQAKKDIVSIVAGADGILRYQLRDGSTTTLQIDTDQVTFQNTPQGVVFTNEDGTTFTLTPDIVKGMIASEYVDTTELEDAISAIDLDQVTSVTFANGNLTITNEDGSTATLPSSVIISSLNQVLATDAELAAAIAAIPQVTVSAGDNVEVVKTGNDYQVNVPIIAFVDKCDVVSSSQVNSVEVPFDAVNIATGFEVNIADMDRTQPLQLVYNFVESNASEIFVAEDASNGNVLFTTAIGNPGGPPLGQQTVDVDLSTYTGNSVFLAIANNGIPRNPLDTVTVSTTVVGNTTSTPYLQRLKDGQPDGTFELDTTTPYTVQGTPTDSNCCDKEEPITLSEGDNVTITQVGNDYQISADGVEFATTAEIDAGGTDNAQKAVSAAEYRKEIYINSGSNYPERKILISNSSNSFTQEHLDNSGGTFTYVGTSSISLQGKNRVGPYVTAVGHGLSYESPTLGNRGNTLLGHRAGISSANTNSTFLGQHSGLINNAEIIASGRLQLLGTTQKSSQLQNLDLSQLPDTRPVVVFYARAGDTLSSTSYSKHTALKNGSVLEIDGTSGSVSNYSISTGDNIDVYVLLEADMFDYATSIGAYARLKAEDDHTVIGRPGHANIYTTATVNCGGVVVTSDERSKKVGEKVHTRQNGIEIYDFTYLANGETKGGWIAQQVEELLRAKGFSEDTINRAIPKKCDVDWQATIKNFNKQIRARISTWPEAQARLDKYVLEKARELGVTEPTVREFLQAVEKVQAEYEAAVAFNKSLADLKPEEGKELPKPKELVPLTDWQEKTYAELSSYNINNYLVCADDIRGIDKDYVLDLLG